jgi:hypothetical protein
MKIGDMDMSDLARLAAMVSMRPNMRYSAALNVERVRGYMETHLGCTPKEIAHSLGLSGDQARRSVQKIRSEWISRGAP